MTWVRCWRCARVRDRPGQDWDDHPAKLPGEVLGICKTCLDLLRQLGERRWIREGKQLLRNRERGYGSGTGDPFAGMREEGKMSETVEIVREERESAPVTREQAGMLAMATMPEAEFEQRLLALKRGQDRIRRIKQELMEEDSHYGVIPGTKKPTLLKPGAEVLCSIYGLRPDFIPTLSVGDGVTAPHLRVTMRCELHLGDIQGPVVAVGYGSANSWERKHRYRRGERACPKCGIVGQIIKGKEEYGGGWLCWKSKGGCGAKWPDGAPEIEGQQAGDVENPDPYDLENTLVKMAKKRAHIDAALTGTASSDLFTQDLEEQGPGEKEHAKAPAQKTAPSKPKPSASGPGSGCPYCGAAEGQVADGPKYIRCSQCNKGYPKPKNANPPAVSQAPEPDEPWEPTAESGA